MKDSRKTTTALLAGVLSALLMAGCAAPLNTNAEEMPARQTASAVQSTAETAGTGTENSESSDEYFSDRDLKQTADLTDAVSLTVKSGEDITITEEGVYVISGTASETTVVVDAEDDAKVQLVLDGVSITNTDFPAIYVKSADKVFITTTDTENTLNVTGSFVSDGDTNTDAVIFSRVVLVVIGTGTLTVSSTDNGITSKDDLKVTGGTYVITAASKAFEANDSIRINDGDFTVSAGTDGFHAENDEDTTLGYIYIAGGTFQVKAGDDAIHAVTTIVIDGGDMNLTAAEGIEATQIEINAGDITISASDDGINAGQKSRSLQVSITINGGNLNITMGAGDTDAIDSNGNLYINGGTINISANSPFDFDGTGQLSGGTVTVNGQTVTALTNQMMGGMGGMQGGMQGGMNSGMQGGRRR